MSDQGLKNLADQLPVRSAETVFAGRLPSAVIVEALIARGLLKVKRKVVDFDDIMSRFRRLQLASGIRGHQTRLLARVDAAFIARSEKTIARSWDAVSVCTDHDVESLRADYPGANVFKVPNVIERPFLPPRSQDGLLRILFVGNLNFSPNSEGLKVFVEQAWPIVRREVPNARLDVVGMFPTPEVELICKVEGLALNADVPSVGPYYECCDLVIAPILFGGGTRIKVLEAMAYGRPIVSTSLGVEGLGIVSERDAILADSMTDFADGVIRLARSEPLRLRLAENARLLQETHFGLPAMTQSVREMVLSAPQTSL